MEILISLNPKKITASSKRPKIAWDKDVFGILSHEVALLKAYRGYVQVREGSSGICGVQSLEFRVQWGPEFGG